jgi:hypothetical protein
MAPLSWLALREVEGKKSTDCGMVGPSAFTVLRLITRLGSAVPTHDYVPDRKCRADGFRA